MQDSMLLLEAASRSSECCELTAIQCLFKATSNQLIGEYEDPLCTAALKFWQYQNIGYNLL